MEQVAARISTARSILRQLCPRCRMGRIFKGSVFRGFPEPYDRCAICGLRFSREPGYFMGAMYLSYGLGLAMVAVLGAILWGVVGFRIDKAALWAVLLFLPFTPILALMSRVLWIYLDQTIDPEQ